MVNIDQFIKKAEDEFLERWKRGPTRLTWTSLPPQVGEKAPNLKLQDFEGNWVELNDFWEEKPTVILFWRHFGCGCGLDRAKRLQEEYKEYITNGANVVIIGQGEPERSKIYAEKYQIPCTILCDPEYKAYETFGLLEGDPFLFLFDAPDNLINREEEATNEIIKSRRETGQPLVDNPWQLQGEFVISTTGVIYLAYHYQYCEDYPNPLVILSAIKKAKKEK
ncbi:MAG: putative peroxiredoxin bcp [Candidatus Heimdallarchaeota archaeon LC_3]|nr:MAG: putative peroxiredoxin bcp [Candidatus Heimdallarchaeota archaeon LC_3]